MAKKKSKLKVSKSSGAAKDSDKSEEGLEETDAITAALSSLNQTIMMKVCRLCESKDGPFLNIFDPETITAKKIEDVIPFVITKNDDLPHKICFRCSAKVEELYEFIHKCIKTQENLRNALGKKGPLATKVKTRALWEEKLNKTNISNEELCDALIKKAMEGIKDFNSTPIEKEKQASVSTSRTESPSLRSKKDLKLGETLKDDNVTLKHLKEHTSQESMIQENKIFPVRASRSNNFEPLLDGLETPFKSKKSAGKKSSNNTKEDTLVTPTKNTMVKEKVENNIKERNKVITTECTVKSEIAMAENKELEENIPKNDAKTNDDEKSPKAKPFDIMDHITMIKVNGVGVLFQCQLCNRNFLKKEVVQTHGCAKHGMSKTDIPKIDIPKPFNPEPPKLPNTIKYINTKVDNTRKADTIKQVSHEITSQPLDSKSTNIDNKRQDDEIENTILAKVAKPKPKIGPASKMKKREQSGLEVKPMETSSPETSRTEKSGSLVPTVNFPTLPSLNSRYKLVPGPNNTFTLVEDQATPEKVPEAPVNNIAKATKPLKRKNLVFEVPVIDIPGDVEQKAVNKKTTQEPVIIEYEGRSTESSLKQHSQPYPVGLFQTVGHHSSTFQGPIVPTPAVFTTPAMKKQSYTVVQTGNPSKLLISTKPHTVVEEIPKKRSKESKTEPTVENAVEKRPFPVSFEGPPPGKDSGYFSFINVDPLVQPCYVLPTDNIIQESQITTSTPRVTAAQNANARDKDRDKYSCNMCGEIFSREKKLLTHIQSHYNKMDDEDILRDKDSKQKKRGRKS